jgi:peptidoglycan/LPS O-acetylase OafA/YrhL
VFYHLFLNRHFVLLKNPFLAVDVFFILSGFIISHAYGRKISQGFSIIEYIVRRIGRLYPLMFISIVTGAPLFYLGTRGEVSNFTGRDALAAFVQNLFMMPYLTGKRAGLYGILLFPGNFPLWSIFFEMVASVSFPFLLRLSDRRLRLFCLCAAGILVVSAFLHGFTGRQHLFDMDSGVNVENFFGGFPRVAFSFSCGMLIYALRERTAGTSSRLATFTVNPWIVYLALVGILIFPSYLQGIYPIFAATVLAPALVWFGSGAICRGRFNIVAAEFLGWLSYPLYCLHIPAFAAVHRLYLHGEDRFGVPEPAAAAAGALALAILAAVLVDRLRVQRRFTGLLVRIAHRVESAT